MSEQLVNLLDNPRIAIHCPEEWQAKILFEYLKDQKRWKWRTGEEYDPEKTYWDSSEKNTYYIVSKGVYGNVREPGGEFVAKFRVIKFTSIIKYLPEKYKRMVVEIM